jgi:nucleotide-binding universal stress UspA family protein
MKNIRRILLPTDFSALSFAAVDYAKSIARNHGARIYVAHVMPPDPLVGIKHVRLTSADVAREIREDAAARMKQIRSKYFRGFSDIETRLLTGTPHEALIRFAVKEKIDLVVIATHGRSGISNVLLGSVAEKMVRHSPVPVLTVKCR